MAAGDDLKDWGKKAVKRLQAAREQKSMFESDFKEAYFFAAPHRRREVNSTTQPTRTAKPDDEGLLQTSIAFELVPDFVTVVINSVMPEHEPWAERRKAPGVDQNAWDQVKEKVQQDDAAIFESMRASALYTEIGKGFSPDLAIGTCGLWIDDDKAFEPIRVLCVPIRELELELGSTGEVDGRWVVRHRRADEIPALLGKGVEIPADLTKQFNQTPDRIHEVRWGFWRDRSANDAETWEHVVMIGQRCIHHATLKGQGCCPLLIGRWNPSPDHPWGYGPLVQALPELRQTDQLEANTTDAVDLAVRPPMSYPDDSFTNIEDGIEAGAFYPVRPGTGGDIRPLYQVQTIDPAVMAREMKEKRLRKIFFVDYPVQSGDTPPSATQWMDEMALAQRRLGTPGMPFWREFACQVFTRFGYLLKKRGIIVDHRVDGRSIGLFPSNPMQRAAELQEVSDNVRALQIAMQAFPEEFKMSIDGQATMKALVDKLRASLIKFRSPQQIQAAVQGISQLMGGAPPAADPAGQVVPGAGIMQ